MKKHVINILILIIQYSYAVIIFPFTIEPQIQNSFIENLFSNNLITIIQIGSNKQNIPIKPSTNTTYLFIPGNEIKGKYDESSSNYFQKRSPQLKTLYNEIYTKGYLTEDNFYFLNSEKKYIENKHFPFFYPTIKGEDKIKTIDAILGFKLRVDKIRKSDDFIYYLREYKSINEEIFSVKFLNETNGEIILGDFPHNYNNKIYKEDYYYTTDISNDKWEISFNKTMSGDKKIEKIKSIFAFDLNFIIGTPNYKIEIVKIFFDKEIKDNKCKENQFNDYIFFTCDESINIKKIPTLYFENNELESKFELNYNDLWVKNEKIWYFLIFFEQNAYSWTFGIPFFKKKEFIFEINKKRIGLYKNNSFSFLWFIIIFFCLIIIIMVYILLFKKKKIKKKKASELLDEFEKNIK